MRKIDKMLQQARADIKANTPGGDLCFTGGICIPQSDKGIFEATANLWNYKTGSERKFEHRKAEFKTEEEVRAYFEEMKSQYPPRAGKDTTEIFIVFDDVVQ